MPIAITYSRPNTSETCDRCYRTVLAYFPGFGINDYLIDVADETIVLEDELLSKITF